MDLASVKSYLGISTDDHNDQLQVLLDGTLAFFRGEIGCELTAHEVEEYYSGGGEQHIFLKQSPIISLTSLQENTGSYNTPVWTNIDNESYVIQEDKGMISFPQGSVPRGFKNIKIVYQAGFTELPKDLEFAIFDTIARSWNRKGSEGKNSERIDDYSITWNRNDISEQTGKVLDRYKIYHV